VYWLSSISTIPAIKSPISLDKIAHIGVYFVFCWFAHRAAFHQLRYRRLRTNALVIAFVATAVYGVLDEIHQRFVPGRSFDVYDMIADAGGGLAFIFVFEFFRRLNLLKEEAEPNV